MKTLSKNVDGLQIIGFIISFLVAIGLWFATEKKEPIASLILGFSLAAFTQGLDMQKRLTDSEERVLKAYKLSTELQRNEMLGDQIQNIVFDSGRFFFVQRKYACLI